HRIRRGCRPGHQQPRRQPVPHPPVPQGLGAVSLRAGTILALGVALVGTAVAIAQAPKPEDTEQWKPVPAVIAPGATDAAPPSDALVLFDGKSLDQWVATRDKSPAKWT